MYLELVKYLVWICFDTLWLLEGLAKWNLERLGREGLYYLSEIPDIVCCGFLKSIAIPHSSCSIETKCHLKVPYYLFRIMILSFSFQGCLCLFTSWRHIETVDYFKIQQGFLRKVLWDICISLWYGISELLDGFLQILVHLSQVVFSSATPWCVLCVAVSTSRS
jgi:hypothetical protein